MRQQISSILFTPGQTGGDSASEDEKSRGVELSKLDLTIELELGDVSTISMTRTKSRSNNDVRRSEC